MDRRSPSPHAASTHARSLLLAAAALLLSAACDPAPPPDAAPPPPVARPHEATPEPGESPTPAPATVSVRGKLLGHRGQPLPLANIELRSASLPEPLRIAAAADGSFELAAPPGVVDLTLTGVDHSSKALTLILDSTGVEFTVQLPTHTLVAATEPANLLLLRTRDAEQPETHKLTSNKAGQRSVTLDLPAGEIRYQLLGHVESGRSTNGTTSTGHEYDGGGDYHSRLTVPGGKFTITFDPQKFPPSGQPGSLVFADPNSHVARSAALIARVRDMDEPFVQAQVAAMHANEPPPTEPAEWPALLDELAVQIRDNTELRNLALVLAFTHSAKTRPAAAPLAATALRELSPTDPLWSVAPRAFLNALAAVPDPDAYQTAVDTLIDHHPDPALGGAYLLSKLEQTTATDAAAAQALYARLQAPRFAATDAAIMSRMYDPARPLLPGRSFPTLDLELLTGGKLDLEQFKGHPVLIDVWATWCSPCVAEMPQLHTLHNQHARGRDRVQFLSIAMDAADSVAEFRRGKWKMPWQHIIVPPDRQPAIYEQLGIIGIPASILLGADGQIVAATPNLELSEIPTHLAALAATPTPTPAPAAATPTRAATPATP